MNIIEFKDQQPQKKAVVVNIIALIVISTLVIYLSYQDDLLKELKYIFESTYRLKILILSILGATILVSILARLMIFKKIYSTFSLSDDGINISGQVYPWSDIQNWHMLGDSQDERIGLVSAREIGNFDLLNTFSGTNIYVLKTKSGFIKSTIRLQVSQDRNNEFLQALQEKNIPRESKTRMYFTNISPWFIIFFAIPFGIFAMVMLWYSL